MFAFFFSVVSDYNMVLLALSYNTGSDGAYHERKFHCILSDVCAFPVFRMSMVRLFMPCRRTSGVCHEGQ